MTELDLHNRRHLDPRLILDIDQFLFSTLIDGYDTSVTVITGNSVKMKEIVISVSDDYGFAVQDGDGISNFGILIVSDQLFL